MKHLLFKNMKIGGSDKGNEGIFTGFTRLRYNYAAAGQDEQDHSACPDSRQKKTACCAGKSVFMTMNTFNINPILLILSKNSFSSRLSGAVLVTPAFLLYTTVMAQIHNEFSWSKSRDEVFMTCPRQYYFNYYGYWGGWKTTAPQRTWQIYMLKNLKNRFMWVGDAVHQCIKHTLKNLQRGISILDAEEIIAITIDKMREEFRSSREKRYRTHPKTCALFEHEYEAGLEDAEWKRVADNVTQCLKNFYGSALFAEFRDLPLESWLEIEDFSFFFLDGTKIWAVLDCSFRTDAGITIVDWKTGRTTREDVSLQLSCYAMYAQEHWKVKPEKIRLIEYNLLSDQKAEFHISKGEIRDTRSYIKGSVADMQSLLVDAKNNIPKDEEFFKKIDDDKIHDRCNFKKVCFP